jgi:hypothetical protein
MTNEGQQIHTFWLDGHHRPLIRVQVDRLQEGMDDLPALLRRRGLPDPAKALQDLGCALGARSRLVLPGCANRHTEVKLSLEGTTVFIPNRYANHPAAASSSRMTRRNIASKSCLRMFSFSTSLISV